MRWLTFVIFALVLLTLEKGLVGFWYLGQTMRITPSLMLVLLVYISASAPRRTCLWAAMALGVLGDLSWTLPIQTGQGVEHVNLLGPITLAYLAGALVAVEMRSLIFRDSPLGLAVLTFVVGLVVQLVYILLITTRGWSLTPGQGVADWHAADQMFRRFFILLYTAALSLPMCWLLLKTDGLWDFHQQPGATRRITGGSGARK